jgi:hypothetical protein
MDLPADAIFYLFWSAVLAVGAVLAFVDRKWIKWPALGLLLPAGIVAGVIMTKVRPFNFADGGLGIQGFLLAAASGLALIGYGLAWIWSFVRRHFGKRAES